MKKILQIYDKGKRQYNLDRIIISDNYAFVVDGYDCSEEHLDLALRGISIENGKISSSFSTELKVKFCISGFHIRDGIVDVYHCGDSRIYAENKGLISNDNTIAWNSIYRKNKNKIKTSDLVRKHISRNILTDQFTSGVSLTPIARLDKFSGNILICTDGFWSSLTEKQILNIISTSTVNSNEFSSYNFSDNASCIVIKI